ncbi:MAG TPA: hypothetical protein VKT81_17170, partial [Bryobacteraceae bacterium]|nr:hypothetical protein [Bryobacteraceae bacterium]
EGRLRGESCLPFTLDRKRSYRADVVVTLLGMPIFSRQGVGSAFASVREAFIDGRKIVSLQFGGGANPERTHGIQYFGSTEEVIQLNPGGMVEAGCFGFVTARHNNQEGLEQARQRLVANGSSASPPVIAVEERVEAGRLKNASATLATDDFALQDWQELPRQVRSAFQRLDVARKDVNFPAGSSTFLYAVLIAIRGAGKSSLDCMHNAKPFRLDFEKAPDGRFGGVSRLTGQIHDLTRGHTSTFRLWLGEGSDLPIRIEFSPRPYLRIALEMDPALDLSNRREDVCREASFTFSGANARQ